MSIVPRHTKLAVRRVRRTPEEARGAAMASARRLLLEQGPDAITLQAVAADLGMSHTNLIHHFGSAGGLQTSLMRDMMTELTTTLQSIHARLRSGQADVHDFVNAMFDAFDSGGAGRLAAWIALSGVTEEHLAPVGVVVRDHVQKVEAAADPSYHNIHERITNVTLLVTMAAFGDAVIGNNFVPMIGRDRGSLRKLIAELVHMIAVPPKKS